jgi:hypothetical protein
MRIFHCHRLASYFSVFLLSLCLPSVVLADFIFSVARRDPNDPIEIGKTAIFDVTVATGPNLQSVSNLAGISFFLGLGDPNNWSSPSPAGTLRPGTNDSSNPLAGGRNYLFTASEGGFFPDQTGTFLVFSVSTGVGRTLTTTPQFLGTFLLDTTNGVPDDYSLRFSESEFGLQDPSSNLLPGPFVGQPLNFTTITAVPEPSTWLLLSIGAVVTGAQGLRNRRSRNVKKTSGV